MEIKIIQTKLFYLNLRFDSSLLYNYFSLNNIKRLMNIQFIKYKLAFNIKNCLAITIGFLIIISINSNSTHLEIFNESVYELNFNSFIVILNTFRFVTPFFILVLLLVITLINIKFLINQRYLLFLIILIFNFYFN